LPFGAGFSKLAIISDKGWACAGFPQITRPDIERIPNKISRRRYRVSTIRPVQWGFAGTGSISGSMASQIANSAIFYARHRQGA
jgi:hypothetical protein